MNIRLITVDQVEVDMIVLEHSGRGRVTKSHPIHNGWFYEYLYIEGEWKGTRGTSQGILANTLWIEER